MSNPCKISPVLKKSVRKLCFQSYHNHSKGCPNWNNSDLCPPKAPLLGAVIDLRKSVWLAYNAFDFGAHVACMREKYPEWSDRQVECCLYWQGTARKQLRVRVATFLDGVTSKHHILYRPEACGVDITATMAAIGIEMEWPPKTVAYQVALIGTPV